MNDNLERLASEMNALAAQFPDAQLPPNCFTSMQAEFVDYASRERLTVAMTVSAGTLNPVGVMQGGFLAAAFDNTFGPLSYLAARRPCSTLDMHINFIRPVKEGERLTVTARVVSRSAVALHLAAEAFNGQGKLVGTSSSQMIVNRQS